MTVLSGSLTALASGKSVSLYYETTVDGDLTNTAQTVGIPVDRDDHPVPGFDRGVGDDDTAAVDELLPDVSIDKTVYSGHDDGVSCEGSERVTGGDGAEVTYCFSVTNTGETDLDVAIADGDLGIDQDDMTVLSGSLTALAPGATVELYHETAIDGDLVNTATVTGTSPAGAQPTDDDTAEVDQVAPAISIDKTVYKGHDAGGSCAGDETAAGENGQFVTYCFTVTNTGDTTLAPVTVDDADLGIDQDAMTVLSGSLDELAPGESVSLYYEATVDGDLINTAVATGAPLDRNDGPVPGFGKGVSDDDDATVDELVPELGLAKTITEAPDGNGDGSYTLTYGIEAQNTGEIDLDQLQITDDLEETFAGAAGFEVDEVTSSDLTVNWPGFDGIATGDPKLLAGTDTLGAGELGRVFITVTVTPGANLGPYDNTAIGSSRTPLDETVTDISDSGTDSDPTRSNPDQPGDTGGTDDPVPTEFPPIDLTIAKVADVDTVPAAGGTVEWSLTVTNDGPGDDGGPITVVDELPETLTYLDAGGSGWDCSDEGQTVTCVWNAPLAAGDSTTLIKISTEATDQGRDSITNVAAVSSTGTETSTSNNDGDAKVAISSADVTPTPTPDATPETLPRTGAAIAGLVLLGLGLVIGGRLLAGRRRKFT
jgi:hypothetical protein